MERSSIKTLAGSLYVVISFIGESSGGLMNLFAKCLCFTLLDLHPRGMAWHRAAPGIVEKQSK